MIETNWPKAAELLLSDGMGVIPTDTIYGFSARINNVSGINHIYEAKQRSSSKPLVILAASPEQILEFFPVEITPKHKEVIEQSRRWPISIVYHLHTQGGAEWSHPQYKRDSFAIRIPYQKPELIKLLEKTGPIVSTSVNQEGKPPYTNLDDICKNFGTQIDFIVDDGILEGKASQIIKITPEGQREILR